MQQSARALAAGTGAAPVVLNDVRERYLWRRGMRSAALKDLVSAVITIWSGGYRAWNPGETPLCPADTTAMTPSTVLTRSPTLVRGSVFATMPPRSLSPHAHARHTPATHRSWSGEDPRPRPPPPDRHTHRAAARPSQSMGNTTSIPIFHRLVRGRRNLGCFSPKVNGAHIQKTRA